jgi:hypothetical protein
MATTVDLKQQAVTNVMTIDESYLDLPQTLTID